MIFCSKNFRNVKKMKSRAIYYEQSTKTIQTETKNHTGVYILTKVKLANMTNILNKTHQG